MRTLSTRAPSAARHSVLRVVPPSHSTTVAGSNSGGNSAARVSRASTGRSVIAAGSPS
jgi:hypothetical protein